MFRSLLLLLFLLPTLLLAQRLDEDLMRALAQRGIAASDLAELRVTDQYLDPHTGFTRTWWRQQRLGVDIFNTEVAVHRTGDGGVVALHHSLAVALEKKATNATPGIAPEAALAMVLQRDGILVPTPRLVANEEGHIHRYEGTLFSGVEPFVQLLWLRVAEDLRLVWNVNYHAPAGDHWWNVRLDAHTGEELERNDWVANCSFGAHGEHAHPASAPPPASPNDYRVFAMPLESPSHGARTLHNAPWTAAPNASPYGWHDTNGAPGAEYTITRGNNVHAQEDANGNNGTGYSPDGGSSLDFDFGLNLNNAPNTYLDAAITNLFYWNNLAHDVWYQYGFNEASGNFQLNNYGNGGQGSDEVYADAQDGSGTDNANFGTPPDGDNPRMQMFIWTYTSPSRDSDLDNGVIVHEYGHGISNRLVGGPSNVNCLGNNEQMGEGWSDWFALMMTIQPGDQAGDPRGIGTYLTGQSPSGNGIRPAPYTTNTGINGYTYANTNSGVSMPHGIGFVWCTMLWELTWDLIGQYGYSPDLYNGTAGNNMAMALVIEGLKLTPCSPGFVDGRNAILAADQALYGGANQALIWAAFARRGLGFSASQGSSSSRTDQVEAFDVPVDVSIGTQLALNPNSAGRYCSGLPLAVRVFNSGLEAQSGFTVRYRLNGGAWVEETFNGTLLSGASATHTFATPAPVLGPGPNTFDFAVQQSGDQIPGDDQLSVLISVPVAPPYLEDLESEELTPVGWDLENPDGGTTWVNLQLNNGPACTASRAWGINFYLYPSQGQQDRLISPSIDLGGGTQSLLRFHQAHARYSSSYSDTLRVEISTDCGLGWTTLWQEQGSTLATAPNSTSNWSPSNCSQWALREVDLSAYDGQEVVIRFVAITGYGNNLYLDNIEVIQTPGAAVRTRMLLEGPYEAANGLMRDDLRAAGLIPSSEPYTALGLAPTDGGTTVEPTVFATTGNDAIVDWVLVELREVGASEQLVARRAALLQRDGDVVDLDGASPVLFSAAPGPYHVALRHRNHLGCMSAMPLTLPALSTVYDLSRIADSGELLATPAHGADPLRNVSGRLLLRAGDVDHNGILRYTGSSNDRDPILQTIGGVIPTATLPGYRAEDVNLDGVVRYTGGNNDRDPILQNIGGVVPTATRSQQLP